MLKLLENPDYDIITNMDDFEKQYDKTAGLFNESYDNQESRLTNEAFFPMITPEIISNIKNKNVLDLGCGAAQDAVFYTEKGFKYFGVDSSVEMCNLAKENKNVTDVRNESFSKKTSFEDNQFGIVVSKYAMQTAPHPAAVYDEVYRLLENNGYFIFLTSHPIRQFLEKKKNGKDYFKKEAVESILFNGKMIATEQSHTFTEYINADFLKKFNLLDVKEGFDFPASEQINGDIYPTFLIVVCQKK